MTRSDDPRIEFHAEAGERVASGHVRRCQTIMEALIRHGAKVRLVGDTGISSLSSRETADFNPDLVLIDSYDADESYLLEARRILQGRQLAYIDDLEQIDFSKKGLADLVISYLPEPDESRYTGVKHRLLGPEYAPLRGEFSSGRDAAAGAEEITLLITSGATDRYLWKKDLLLKLIQIYTEKSRPHAEVPGPLAIDMIAGSYEDLSGYEALFSGVRDDSRTGDVCNYSSDTETGGDHPVCTAVTQGGVLIRLYQNVSDMASLMSKTTLAVSGGGTTLYELCAMGIPTVIRPGSEWERNFAASMSRASGMPLTDSTHETADAVFSLLADDTARKSLADRMHTMTDGRGADRIACKIIEVLCKP